jgi:aldose sugar dehydrogenase
MQARKQSSRTGAGTNGARRSARIGVAVVAVSTVILMAPRLPRAFAVMSPTFTQTNLVSDVPGLAKTTDPNLVNSWGMALGLNGGLWVADNGSGKATSYDGAGTPLPAGSPLAVTIPAPGGGTSAPTGVATNATTGFTIGNSLPSSELFSTEDGTIAGWNQNVDATHAVIAVDNSAKGAVYKGLAIGFNGEGAFLFATNFKSGTIDVFDSQFRPVQTKGFKDPKLPDGYAPFGIAPINGKLYVTYAVQDAAMKDDVPGLGHGFIDIFDTEGKLLNRFVSQGPLNSPWGMAWAPFEGFGSFANALMVGNFGDGAINAFDFDSGAFLGRVSDANGAPITIPGVWGLEFGLGVANADSGTLFFTAGIHDEQHGLFGSLTVNKSSLPAPSGPAMTDPSLHVTTVVSGLNQPTSMVFLGPGDFLVLEKASGKVQHVVSGAVVNTALTLPVNSASERGLLGIALQPDFATSHGVYIYWTQSLSGSVSSDISDVPLLGNRVDRFVWNPATQMLTMDRNIIMLRSYQADSADPCCGSALGEPKRGNHDGGKILFGPDGKLYFQIGDQGRRGQLQNLAGGPFGSGQPDDQFGGPAPDDAHLTGAVFRLNPDGSVPSDNPFANVTTAQMAQLEQQAGVSLTPSQLSNVTANVRKVFSYGRRNGFGLAFDPVTGLLWESENGDDAMDEINQITAGSNGGWIQIMGPSSRLADYKQIETSFTPLQGNLPVAGNVPFSAIDPTTFFPALQQIRWPPTLIANSPAEAMSRLFVLPGSQYSNPEFSWKWATAPSAIGFAGGGLGPQHTGNLFVGASRTFLDAGYLFEFQFDNSRRHLSFSNPGLRDGIDNNDYKFDEGQSAPLIAGKNFGIATNIVAGPDGNLYVTSLTKGTVYMISR